MNGLIWFIIIFFGVIIIAGLFIVTFLLGKRTVRNNPKNAIVFVKNGMEVLALKGKMDGQPSNKGTRYTYTSTTESKNETVLVPTGYKEIYCKNRRVIYINHQGQLVATPYDRDPILSKDERDELIYELVSSKIGADGMRAMKGHSGTSVVIVGIIAFIVGVGAVLIFNFISDQMAITQQAPPPAQTQTETTDDTTPPIGIVDEQTDDVPVIVNEGE